jgi:hypothetical protein
MLKVAGDKCQADGFVAYARYDWATKIPDALYLDPASMIDTARSIVFL